MGESTHVQTELSNEAYDHFKSLAQERGLSLAAALREATEIWMEQQRQVDPDDPLFEIIEELEREPVSDAPRTNAASEDDLVEEWRGSTAGVRFSAISDSERDGTLD